MVLLPETWLDAATEEARLEGYVVAGRGDRVEGRQGGGVIAFAAREIAGRVALLDSSATHERWWLLLHGDQGSFLLGAWYRPPAPGETASIEPCVDEWRVEGPGVGDC